MTAAQPKQSLHKGNNARVLVWILAGSVLLILCIRQYLLEDVVPSNLRSDNPGNTRSQRTPTQGRATGYESSRIVTKRLCLVLPVVAAVICLLEDFCFNSCASSEKSTSNCCIAQLPYTLCVGTPCESKLLFHSTQ